MDYLFEPAPNDEAISFIASKVPLRRAQFDRLLPELRSLAFTISGVHAADAVQDIRDMVAMLPAGERFEDLQKSIARKLLMHQSKSSDPEDSEEKRKQQALVKARFLLRHHGNQAYAVTAYNEMEEFGDIMPYWKYLTVGDDGVRDTHRALNGLILPKSHEFWRTHFPPWEFGCRCQVVPVTKAEYERYVAKDKGKPAVDRVTLTDAELERLTNERKLVRKIAGVPVDVDLRAPAERHDDDPYIFHPNQLQIPLQSLKARYDEATWKAFEGWARRSKVGETTVWQWLNQGRQQESTPKVSPPVPAFPESPEGLTVVRQLGGSTGAVLVRDASGREYVMKRGANAGHLREEVFADDIYRALGVPVPESRLYETPGGPVKLSVFMQGTSLANYLKTASATDRDAVLAKLREHFAADALLGNWDVVGQDLDNILVDAAGVPWRIDNGGALRYRAKGALKGAAWNEHPEELWTLRNGKTNRQTAAIFGSSSIYDLARGIERLNAASLPAGLPDELSRVVQARLGHLRDMATKALDMEHDKWRAGYADQLTRHMMGLRKSGITDRLPKQLTQAPREVTVKDENGVLWDSLRTSPVTGARSLVTELADYIKAQGGDPSAITRWKASQAGDSWNEWAQAYKAFLATHLDLPASSVFWKQGKAHADAALAKYRTSDAVDTAWIAHHAFVQELLGRTELRYNDRKTRHVRLVRTESRGLMQAQGITKGAKGAKFKTRGLCESSSIFRATTVYGTEVTVQAVPHSRVTGIYLMEQTPGRGDSGFYNDSENEVTFIGPELATNYGPARMDGGNDATKWGTVLNGRP